MNLCKIHPPQIYRWFKNVYWCLWLGDGSEMYGMSLLQMAEWWVQNRQRTNYVLKWADYPSNEMHQIWDALLNFIDENQTFPKTKIRNDAEQLEQNER